MMYLLRLWAGVSQCKITQYLYVQKTNLPGVFSWFQRGVFNPDPQRPVKNWFWQRTILQAVFFSKTEWRTCWATWLSTWSPLSLQIFHQSIKPLTIQTFPTKCWRKFLFITPAFGVFFFAPARPLKKRHGLQSVKMDRHVELCVWSHDFFDVKILYFLQVVFLHVCYICNYYYTVVSP